MNLETNTIFGTVMTGPDLEPKNFNPEPKSIQHLGQFSNNGDKTWNKAIYKAPITESFEVLDFDPRTSEPKSLPYLCYFRITAMQLEQLLLMSIL